MSKATKQEFRGARAIPRIIPPSHTPNHTCDSYPLYQPPGTATSKKHTHPCVDLLPGGLNEKPTWTFFSGGFTTTPGVSRHGVCVRPFTSPRSKSVVCALLFFYRAGDVTHPICNRTREITMQTIAFVCEISPGTSTSTIAHN